MLNTRRNMGLGKGHNLELVKIEDYLIDEFLYNF